MKITYYGTAAGEAWPGVFCDCELCRKARELGGKNIRTRSQALINDDLLVDMPPDNYLHTLYFGLDLSKVRTLIFTGGSGTAAGTFFPYVSGTDAGIRQ